MSYKNQKGFTLVEIIIATGLLAALSLGVMSVFKNMQKGQVTSETKMEELELRRVIATTLTDQTACQNTLANTNIGTQITQIKNSAGTVMYQVGNTYGNGALQISGLITQDRVPAEIFSDGTRMVDLVVSFQKMKKLVTANVVSANIAVRVKAPSSTGTITSCFADANAIVEQSCLAGGGTWTGSMCTYSQYVKKTGDTMSGNLSAPLFNGNISGTTGTFTGNVTAAQFCTGANCKAIGDLALSNKTCPAGQVQIGVQGSGLPNCVALQCGATQFFAGLDSSGNQICRPLPTTSCPANTYVSLVNADGTVQCTPIPNTATATCPVGQVLQSINAGVATCVAHNSGSCAAGQFVQSVNADGSLICATPGGAGGACSSPFVMTGINPNGTPICQKLTMISQYFYYNQFQQTGTTSMTLNFPACSAGFLDGSVIVTSSDFWDGYDWNSTFTTACTTTSCTIAANTQNWYGYLLSSDSHMQNGYWTYTISVTKQCLYPGW